MPLVFCSDGVRAAGRSTLLGQYGPGEFSSPTRSTVPLLSLLWHGGELWQSIVAELGMKAGEAAVHLEYTVAPPLGRGRASHTDAMLIAGDRACAMEAKWTEPAYKTVGEWLDAKPGQANRRTVLTGWLSLLQPYATRELHADDFREVTYQTVHRAASACSAAGRWPGLAYLLFTPRPDGLPADAGHLREGLGRLASALGHPAGFPLRLAEVEARPTAAVESICTLPKGKPSTGRAVRRALREAPLFTFPEYRMHPVGGSFV